MKTASSRGFTLIELMIVVAVIGILAAVAYPSYQDSVRKSRRADGQTALLQAVQVAERFFTRNNSYLGVDIAAASDEGHYDLTFEGDANSFDITAAPAGAQASDRCGELTINELNVKGGAVADCW
jgi:type IV pilus assembly protein PilE